MRSQAGGTRPCSAKRSAGRQAQGWGFTMVEVLIIIVILSLLIGLAVPAFVRAQSQAKRLRCKGNLRQIYTALSNYATDNMGLLPTCDPGGDEAIPWPPGRETVTSVNEDVSSNVIGMKSDPAGLGKLSGQLDDDLRVFFCPGDGRRRAEEYRDRFVNNQLLPSGDPVDCSYLYRGRDAPDKVDTVAIRRFAADRDTVRALVMDYYYAGMSRPFHGDRICILFEDGHTLDVLVTRGAEVNRFVDPGTGPAARDPIWRRADGLYAADD